MSMANLLFEKLEKIDHTEFYEIEPDIYALFYNDDNLCSIPEINAFLIVSEWFGTSDRSGVWTFYEVVNQERVEAAVEFLKYNAFSELADMLKKGMHDYANPKYQENFDYPEEWIGESEEIDLWINQHREWLEKWLFNVAINCKRYALR